MNNDRYEIKGIFENFEDAVKEALRNLTNGQLTQIAKMIGVDPVREHSEFFYNDTVEDIEQELFDLPEDDWARVTREIFNRYLNNRKKKK
jgi:hypothetical protein